MEPAQLRGSRGIGSESSTTAIVETAVPECFAHALFLSRRRYVTLKIFIRSKSMGQQLDNELMMYQRIEKGSRSMCPARRTVRSLLILSMLMGSKTSIDVLYIPRFGRVYCSSCTVTQCGGYLYQSWHLFLSAYFWR